MLGLGVVQENSVLQPTSCKVSCPQGWRQVVFGVKVGWHSITLYITQGWHSITAHADVAHNNNPPAAAVTKHEKLDLPGNEEEAFNDPQDFKEMEMWDRMVTNGGTLPLPLMVMVMEIIKIIKMIMRLRMMWERMVTGGL